MSRSWRPRYVPFIGAKVISGLDKLLQDTGVAGLTELRELLQHLLGKNGEAGCLVEQEALQPGQSRVFRLRFVTDGNSRSVVIKRLKPEVAQRNELVATRWLPAIGLSATGPPLLGRVADRTGACVWHVYEDLGPWQLDPDKPHREWVESTMNLVAEIHTQFAGHPLLGEVRMHGGDAGIHFYESNLRDAIYALTACESTGQQTQLRERLLDRLHGLLRELPKRREALEADAGIETLLHGDLWSINVFVIPGVNGSHARLIDWDHATVGPAVYDISTFLLRFPTEQRSWILQLYTDAVASRGWRTPPASELNYLFETSEYARLANLVIWPAIAWVRDRSSWSWNALAEVEKWFMDFKPVLPRELQVNARIEQ
jgi:Phosphotransferase enzyme family